MRISDVLRDKNHRLITAFATASIAKAVAQMRDEHVGALVIRDENDHLIGVLSERDIVLGLYDHGHDLLKLPVRELMKREGPVASPADSIVDTMKLMTEYRVRHLPVIDNSVVIGLVSIGDITKYRLAEKIEENSVLRDMARFRLAAAA